MAAEIPTREPEIFTAGETVKWKKTLTDYPPSTFTLKYYLRGPSKLDVTATASGTAHLATISSASSADLHAGEYRWYAQATETATSEVTQVAEGQLEVKGNPVYFEAGKDTRTHAKKMLDAIEAMLEGNASKEEASLTFPDGRSISYVPKADLIRMRSVYKQEVAAEEAIERAKLGLGSGNKIKIRFRSPWQ